MNASEPLVVSRREAARLLAVSVRTLDKLVSEKTISPPVRLASGTIRFDLAKLRADIARLGGKQSEVSNPWNEVLAGGQ